MFSHFSLQQSKLTGQSALVAHLAMQVCVGMSHTVPVGHSGSALHPVHTCLVGSHVSVPQSALFLQPMLHDVPSQYRPAGHTSSVGKHSTHFDELGSQTGVLVLAAQSDLDLHPLGPPPVPLPPSWVPPDPPEPPLPPPSTPPPAPAPPPTPASPGWSKPLKSGTEHAPKTPRVASTATERRVAVILAKIQILAHAHLGRRTTECRCRAYTPTRPHEGA